MQSVGLDGDKWLTLGTPDGNRHNEKEEEEQERVK